MTRNSLWKLFSITAVLALLLVACGGDDDDAEPTSTSPSAVGAPTETREASDGGGGGGDDPLIAMGQQLYNEQGCVGCHSTDGSANVGPTWQGLLGHEVPLDDGTTVIADEAYIEESIRTPGAHVVEGFQNIMPAYDSLTDEQIAAIIAFIGSLS